MAEDTPNPPQTVVDWSAAQKLAEAQTAAADAQAKLIVSQRMLAAVQQAGAVTDAANLAAAQQAANVAAAQQKQAEAAAATTKSEFAVPDSGYKGEVAAGAKAGELEAALLAAKALNIAAGRICDKLSVLSRGQTVVLYGTADLPNFQALISYNAQRELLDLALNNALEKSSAANIAAQAQLGPKTEFAPEVIGAGLDAANKLLGFFRTDYTVNGVDVKLDDLLVTNALAASLLKKHIKVQMPAVYNVSNQSGESAFLNNLEALATKRGQLQQSMAVSDKLSQALAASAGSEKDNDKKNAEQQKVAVLKEASDSAKVAIGMYDTFFTKLSASDDKSNTPLATVIQQDAVSHLLAQGAYLMTIKLGVSGGSLYTKKNMWTFFGRMPFYNMGGVVVTYSLFDGKAGDLLAAGTIPVDGGYAKSSELPKALQE